jgi:predicted acylesterase/phospholipase RssA
MSTACVLVRVGFMELALKEQIMSKIGLALSGGGFRATLYHLGLVRFLHDAGILPQVTHITSVSGGSIIGAHLVLNWDRYNGSSNDFDAAASELVSFVRLGVRNRIVRRFPLTIPLRWPRRFLGFSNRKLTRTGLLEYHYEKYLYGDTSLFELPEMPQLHILTTNVTEGCLCSFNRSGLLMVRRQSENTFRIDRVHTGLATVPMAVAASSAFPGFFPPLVLTAADVGANVGEFGRQAYTDGGIFDNLGVRMFRFLERLLMTETRLSRDDFYDLPEVIVALREASKSGEETPLRRLAQILVEAGKSSGEIRLLRVALGMEEVDGRPDLLLHANEGETSNIQPPSFTPGRDDSEALILSALWDVMRHHHFNREPLFSHLKPLDPGAESLLNACKVDGRILDAVDQLWLNQHLLEAAFRRVTRDACFRRLNSGLDGVLVSDVGKRIAVKGNQRSGGLIRTAMRSTDILMDRVWQLEHETFHDGTPGYVFAPITDVVGVGQDATALHPEIQRQLAKIRTDLDQFSMLEISSLVRHGYCVARKACREHPRLFGADLPGNAPWDPIPASRRTATAVPVATVRKGGKSREPAPTTVEARTLQDSSLRHVWSTLLDRWDWTSYVYVPLLVPILFLLPYFIVKYYERSHIDYALIQSFAKGSRDLEQLSRLLENGPDKPWIGWEPEVVSKLDEPDFKGFEILQDSSIIDLRPAGATGGGEPGSYIGTYRRLKVLRQPGTEGNTIFHVPLGSQSCMWQVRFPPQQLQGRLRKTIDLEDTAERSATREKHCDWELTYDFQKVPAGNSVNLLWEGLLQTSYRGETSHTYSFPVAVETAELTKWILMPKRKLFKDFRFIRYPTGHPETVEPVQYVTEYMTEDATILAYELLGLEPGYTYENIWSYK